MQAGTVSAAGTIPLVAPTKLHHDQYEDVYALFGDQLKVYRATNVDGSQPADTAFLLVGRPVTIDANDTTTAFTDPTGGGGYWYKYTHYNSVTLSETDLASATARRGNFSVEYCSDSDIRAEAGFTYAPYITDGMIDTKRQAAQAEVDSTLSSYYKVPFVAPISSLLSDICKRLAAGLLLQEKYSYINNPDTNGTNKLTEARAELQKLIHPELNGTPLLDSNGQSIALPNPNTSASSWPDTTTATSDPAYGGAPRYFRMSSVDGYQSRDF